MDSRTAEITQEHGRSAPVIGPRLRLVLRVVLVSFGLLSLNTAYLLAVSGLEWATGSGYQESFYLWMFLVHLALGLILILPTLIFAALHVRNAYQRPNRRAVRAGLALFGTILVLLVSGLVLTRYSFFAFRSPTIRTIAYWAHVVSPLLVVWLFVLHRLAGPRIRWGLGLGWTAMTAGCAAGAVVWLLIASSPGGVRQTHTETPSARFSPSLLQTTTDTYLPAQLFMQDGYCQECHSDIHANWAASAHRFSSFNNPAYLFSIRELRRMLLSRDTNTHASRFCAACHDPVPLLSGDFDDPGFDVEHPTAEAGITCSVCHSVQTITSPRGNGAYVIAKPVHYPFTFSPNRFLRALGRQLVKAKPALHKKTFLKPLHRTAEFCGTCHKVHLPAQLNRYRWLRGQNHYDAFLLSGVSGHGVSSFYYPPTAFANCNTCHMPLLASDDFGARVSETGRLPASIF